MASLTKKLYYAKSGTNKTIKLYSAKSDCLDTTTGPFVHVNLDGTTGYAGLVSGDGKGSYPSDMRVEFNGSTYTVQNTGYHKITITQPANGQIKVTHNGTTYTTSFDAMMEGVYIVTATPNSGYELTALKVGSSSINNGSSQTCSKKVTITATMAKMGPSTIKRLTTSTTQAIDVGAASTTNYAVFGGGTTGTSLTDPVVKSVAAVNASLTVTNATDFTTARSSPVGVSIGEYALFGGGRTDNYNLKPTNAVDAYNASLTKSAPSTLRTAVHEHAGTSVGNYALLGGGVNSNASMISTVTAYNKSLTRSSPSALKAATDRLGAASNASYALFAGGRTGSGLTSGPSTNVTAYNTSLTRSYPTALNTGSIFPTGTKVGNYALFAGGMSDLLSSTYVTVVNAYNTSLTRSVPTALTSGEPWCGTWLPNYAVLSWGYDTITYDKSLTQAIIRTSIGVYGGAGTALSSYAFVGVDDMAIVVFSE